MNNTIKYLESLGQNASIKQFDSLDEMINKMEKNEGVMANSISSDNDLVCGLFTSMFSCFSKFKIVLLFVRSFFNWRSASVSPFVKP